MPLRRVREELAILSVHLESDAPNLEFLVVHAEAMLTALRFAEEGHIYGDTTEEDAEMIRRHRADRTAQGLF